MSDTKLKIAVFIDFDNIEIGVKTTLNLAFDIGAVLEAIKERGEVVTKLAYGDWKRSGDYGRAMAQHAVRMVQRVTTPGGDKNGADINLALDALEMAFTHAHINAFVIVGGDSDFITLVEKLKQYDRKVFVVGGRAFTSQVMQKNCTEFIAYENVVPDRPSRQPRQEKGERPKSSGTQAIELAAPLVMRALKVLTDREVTPQLGLLKSTLLQLDSSFSERDYGAGSFREFADKLAKQGLVSLKHQGRSTLVELPDSGAGHQDASHPEVSSAPTNGGGHSSHDSHQVETRSLRTNPSTHDSPQADGRSHRTNGRNGGGQAKAETLTELLEQPDSVPQDASLGDGVALVRRLLTEATTQPRWPMYPRQFKQFLRTAQPDFDERKYGSIADLMRACQKDGLLRLERDRQGALRVFASGGAPRASVPHGWGVAIRENGSEQAPETDTQPVVDVVPEVIAAPEIVDAQITEVVEEPIEAPKAKRKTAAKRKAAPKTPRRTRTVKKTEN
ncbi:MAG TPA: NYN domain-containing protein [Vicinamibacterales bacterium]|nr:NYN domain-containing protein [Vicinamibacterales bacterium]